MHDWKMAALALGEAVAKIAEELDRFRDLADDARFALDEDAARIISSSIRAVGEACGDATMATFALGSETAPR
tara:strand:- start:859 stop:1077 length:219 start_codon:yes stop_codon:yes gene_type:complete